MGIGHSFRSRGTGTGPGVLKNSAFFSSAIEPVYSEDGCLFEYLLIEGGILGSFVILNGCWVILTPPYGDEPQGYAIAAIGLFILILTYELVRRNSMRDEESA
jgi:hypothetical protein